MSHVVSPRYKEIVLSNVVIRNAAVKDAGLILKFITELAIFEKAEHEVIATVDDIEKNLFDPETTTKAIICSIDGETVGFAVYFLNYSTWLGKNGLFLEDLYVSPSYRAKGAGKKILRHLANIAVSNDCGRFEWNVLDWNEPAILFYDSIGAKPQSEWIGYRLEGNSLIDFANSK
ncbi:MAG: GNAT superfamily N-acetyltransferase [Oceanicoccus sp.]|jgi:GNAT superfamily N-acetyltransferase